MWLARQMRSAPPTADADMGVTTIAGDRVGVLTGARCGTAGLWSRRLCLAAGKRGGAGDQGRPWRRGTVCGRDGAERSAQGHAARERFISMAPAAALSTCGKMVWWTFEGG